MENIYVLEELYNSTTSNLKKETQTSNPCTFSLTTTTNSRNQLTDSPTHTSTPPRISIPFTCATLSPSYRNLLPRSFHIPPIPKRSHRRISRRRIQREEETYYYRYFHPLNGPRTLISLVSGERSSRSHDSGQWDAAMIVVDERQFRSAVAKSLVADAKCIFIPAKQFDHGGGHPWREVGIRECTPCCVSSRRGGCRRFVGQAWEDGGIGGRALGNIGGKRDDIFAKDRIELVKVVHRRGRRSIRRKLKQWKNVRIFRFCL